MSMRDAQSDTHAFETSESRLRAAALANLRGDSGDYLFVKSNISDVSLMRIMKVRVED